MADAAQGPGLYTVIVAREGTPDPSRDEGLLRGVEVAMGLRRGALSRSEGMDRPEFRLIEGVSREMADRLAGLAVEQGYAPRVRDRLGIKWSSERGQPMMAFGMVAVMAAWAMAMTAATATFGEVAMLPSGALALVLVWGVLRTWRRAMYLPLVVDRTALPAPTPVEEGSPASEAVTEATDALERLGRAIVDDAPDAARPDLERTHAELNDRVTELQRQVAGLSLQPSGALRALRDRLGRLDADDPSTAEERATLQQSLDEEAAALGDAEARHSAILAELMGLRRTVLQAVADLQADDPERDPTAGLRRQVSALRSATDEARDRGRRAQAASAARTQHAGPRGGSDGG